MLHYILFACIIVFVDGYFHCHSFCIVSDGMYHDVSLVHQMQKECIQHVRGKIPNLTKIIDFSEGYAAQCKNRKNFLSLCYHTTDFNVAAEWTFFATSHGNLSVMALAGPSSKWIPGQVYSDLMMIRF